MIQYIFLENGFIDAFHAPTCCTKNGNKIKIYKVLYNRPRAHCHCLACRSDSGIVTILKRPEQGILSGNKCLEEQWGI
jgi:hypothetical protein